MGTWGTGIFQNDTACDVRDSYREKIIVGQADCLSEQAVIHEFQDNSEEEFWVPLAITQWKIGRLSKVVRNNALLAIERELSILPELWKKTQIPKRERVLLEVQTLLNTEMPKRKKLGMPSWAWKCPWPVGSVLQFKIIYPIQDNPLFNHYILLQLLKISETKPDKIPIESIAIGLYDWHGMIPPYICISEILSAPPKLIPFCLASGFRRMSTCLLLSNEMIREHDICSIAETPLHCKPIEEEINTHSYANSTFEDSAIRALTRN